MEGGRRRKNPKTPRRRANQQGEGHKAIKGGEDTGKTEDEEGEEEGDRDRVTPRGDPVEGPCVGGDNTPT